MWQIILSLYLVLLFCLPAGHTLAAGKKPVWNWTEHNPKPEWWYWGDKYEKSKPVRGGYLRQAAPKYIGLMNPNHWPVNDWNTITYIYESPIFNNGDFKPSINWLFESWEFTTPKTAVVKLKKGIKFHDGADFNAEGFKYQIEWIQDPKNGAWSKSQLAPIIAIDVVDDHTLKFTFDRVWASFAGFIGAIPGFAISPKALKADEALAEVGKIERKAVTAKKKIAKLLNIPLKVYDKNLEEYIKDLRK